ETAGTSGFHLNLHVDQVQDGTGLFTMPLEVRLTRASGDTTVTIWAGAGDYTWDLAESTTALALDPDDHVLKQVTMVPAPETSASAALGLNGGLAVDAPSPNPWMSSVRISFQLAGAGPVTVSVYDVQGRRVFSTAPSSMDAGRHEWRWDG